MSVLIDISVCAGCEKYHEELDELYWRGKRARCQLWQDMTDWSTPFMMGCYRVPSRCPCKKDQESVKRLREL